MKISLNASLIFAILFFAASFSFADSVTQTWTNTYNSPWNLSDMLAGMAVDNSGNVYVTGTSMVGSNTDITTVKYNSAGDLQWIRNYDSGSLLNDTAAAIAVDALGNIYVAGQSNTTTSGLSVARLIKYNPAGTLMWTTTYQGTNNVGNNLFKSIVTDGSDNIYVTGVCASKTTGQDYVTIKYNSGGTLVWDKTHNQTGTGDETAAAIALDSALNVYVTGDKCTVKYNNAGVLQWADGNYPGSAIAIDPSAYVYVLNIFGPTFYVANYAPDGTRLWVSPYPPTSGATVYPSGIAVDASGNYFVTGLASPGGILTAKFDPDGFLIWDAFYNAITGPPYPGSIATDPWGGVYTSATVNYNLMTFKYDADGNEKWNMVFSSGLNSGMPTPIIVKSGTVYVGSSAFSPTTSLNYAAVQYDQHFCKQHRAGDINGDCKVNFEDFALLVQYWLECNRYPASDCDQ
jgi:hypothetical protein